MREIIQGDGFYISYNSTCMQSGPETAIVLDGHYYILDGDHREGYRPLVPRGPNACMEYFRARPEERSFWSDG